MTVVRPNSISGINSITVATGEALSIHAANGDLVTTLTSSSGIATYKGIHVGSGTTTSNQGVSVGTGASIVSDAVNQLDVYTNNSKRLSIGSDGIVTVSSEAAIINRNAGDPYLAYQTAGTSNAVIYGGATTGLRGFTKPSGGSLTERIRIDADCLIANGALAPSDYGSPNLLISGTDSTLTMMGNGSTNNTSFTGIKFRVAGGSTGDYTKAAIFSRREGSYNDLSLIFALDTAADATSVSIADEKMRIDSTGRVGINTATLTTANAGFDDLVIRSSAGGNTGITLLSSTTAQGTIAFADGGSSTEPYRGYVQYSHSGDTMMFGLSGADKIRIGSSGEIGVAGAGSLNNGSSGQVLTSGGNSAGCTWQDAAAGIDEADIWRLTTSFQGNASGGFIGSNWERGDTDGQNHKGTGMSESSGVFTFPSTGFWFVQFTFNMTTQYTPSQPHSHRNTGYIQTCIDGSSYAVAASSASGIYNFGSNSYPSHGTGTASIIFDVTSTSNCKCRFNWGAGQGSETCTGDTSSNQTYVTFIRLADT